MGEGHAGPRSGRRRGWSRERRRLRELGLVPGVDFCDYALELSERGRVVEPEHLAVCAVCVRRWRVTEAELQPWAAMGHEEAAAILPSMAETFESGEREGRYRPFYAHLARCHACEHELARLTFARLAPARHTAALRR